MNSYRIVLVGNGEAFLVHAGGKKKKAAEKAAIEKVAKDNHLSRHSLRVKRSERIYECV